MPAALTDDGSYYFKDGNCNFQAEGYAFKVHRHLFTRESAFFQNLLVQSQKTSQDDTEVTTEYSKEGKVDDMLMVDEPAESFRALCWGLYAKPIEIREQADLQTVNIHRLVSLALIAHKYEFTLLEKWSIDVLRTHWMADFASDAAPATLRIQWRVDTIEQLVILSTKADPIDPAFKKTIEAQWLSHSIAKAETPSTVQRALEFADSLSSGRHRGLAYYHTLRRLGKFQARPLGNRGGIEPGSFQSYNNLGDMLSEFDPYYRLKLMRGFWCLMSLRRENSLREVLLERASSHKGHKYCISEWRGENLDDFRDFGAALEEGLRRLQSHTGIAKRLSRSCREFLLSKFQTLLAAFEENLVNYFVLPE